MVFISGMTARDIDGQIVGAGDIDKQTRQVCENLSRAMSAAGRDVERHRACRRVRAQHRTFRRGSPVRREYFDAPAPASTMLEVSKMVSPDMLIEINAIGVVDDAHAAD